MFLKSTKGFLKYIMSRYGSHRDKFGESLETLSAVKSQSWFSFLGYRFLYP
jgi:hypothetical protein